jgi:cell division protein FtsI (penicillin-binding protein 3)
LKSRIFTLFGGILLLWGLILVRGAFLQFFPHEKLQALQERQFQSIISVQNRRGIIVDRSERELALSMTAYSLYADPKLLTGRKKLARKLAKELNLTVESVYSKIKDDSRRFIWIARQLEPQKYEKIKALGIHGLGFINEYRRVYPNEGLLSTTLGMVGSEGQGLEGLELSLEGMLKAEKKRIALLRDARGRPLLAENPLTESEHKDGTEVMLTIDVELQHMLESELSKAISEFDADQAFGIILDAKNSEVLAMSNLPGFDANVAGKVPPELRRNRSVTDTYEPGSTMKAFVIATALREKLVAPNTKFNTENGRFQIGNKTIHEAETHEKWPSLTVSEILAYSSNIGTSKIALMIGDQKLRQGLADFGFGNRSGVLLPGEAKGSLQELPWQDHLLANISFGHGISVTSLQVANAYAVIANGGNLYTPKIVKGIRDPITSEWIETPQTPIRRVISPEDAAQMRLMLMGVTTPGGTGVNANVEGFLVAGKTGTAQKANINARGYMPNAYISSFAGFIPATDPRFVVYVVVDHPKKKNSYYGSQVAAPIFSRIAGFAARKAGLAPVLVSAKNLIPSQSGPRVEKNDRKLIISPRSAHEIINLPGSTATMDAGNLSGLTLREVLQRASGNSIRIKLNGSAGVVHETQTDASGEILVRLNDQELNSDHR